MVQMNIAFSLAFNVTAKEGMKYRSTIDTIALAGYMSARADPTQITDEDIIENRVLLATANARAITRLLISGEKQILFEQILENFGVGHLIRIRLITYSDTRWLEI